MSVQIKKNGVWEAVAGNATNTSGITESSALANIGTAANATQHDINVAIDGNALLSKADPVEGGQTFNGDLNDLTTPGVYSIATSTGHLPSNLPSDSALYGTAVVYKGKYGYITQEVSSATASRKWIRTRNEYGTWNVWVEVTEPKTVSLYLLTSDLGITAGSTISIDTFIQKLWVYLTAMYPQHMGYFNVSGMMNWHDADGFYITDGSNTVSSSGSQFNFFVRYAPWSSSGGIFITSDVGTYVVKCKYLDTVSNIQQVISHLATS